MLILGVVVGFLLGRELKVRRRTAALRAQLHTTGGDLLRAEADLKAARIDRDYYHQRFEQVLLDLAKVEADRDRYREIASSHELSWPEAPPEPVTQHVPIWRGRRYAHHPASNLTALCADLQEHLAHEVRLTLWVEPLGGWDSRIRAMGPLSWEGPGQRVIEELRCWLVDDNTRLMKRDPDGEKVWADADSPLLFRVDMERLERSPPGVHIHEVEVLHVEQRIEERFIEQPVIIEVPLHRLNDPTPGERIGLTREEVLALFDQQLQTRLSELGLYQDDADELSIVRQRARRKTERSL